MRKNDAILFKHQNSADFKKKYLLISDVHIDSMQCDRDLLKRVLDEAKRDDATVLIFGDLFDLMGGKFDKRTNKADIGTAYQVAEYFDEVVKDAADFLEPYKKNIGIISMGNHEESVVRIHETNPVRNLIYRLGGQIEYGGYTGFIRFMFWTGSGSNRHSKTLYYTHGSGGNSPVTKGVIQTNRRTASIDADFFVSGHIHQSWNVSHSRVKLNEQCKIKTYDQEHIQLGTFKDAGSWEQSKGFNAPTKGGQWLEFYGLGPKHKVWRAV